MDGKRFDQLTRDLAGGVSRRRILFGAVGGTLSGITSLARSRDGFAANKVVVCHRTGSANHHVRQIEVSVNAVKAHEAHGDVIAPDFQNDPANCGGCGISCDSGDACTIDTCQSGVCVQTPLDCSAFSDECTVGVCKLGHCESQPANEGASCNGGNACIQGGTCQNGVCAGGTSIVCTASDQCHVAGECDPATGVCSNPAVPNGTPCDDGSACTQGDVCQNGACVGTSQVVCTPSDQCHLAGQCNPNTGVCSDPMAPDGTPCDDGELCTIAACQDGVCIGALPTCPPLKRFNPDTCECECRNVLACGGSVDDDCNCICTQLICGVQRQDCSFEYGLEFDSCSCGRSTDGVGFCGAHACGEPCLSQSDCPPGFFCEQLGNCCQNQTCVAECGSVVATSFAASSQPTKRRW